MKNLQKFKKLLMYRYNRGECKMDNKKNLLKVGDYFNFAGDADGQRMVVAYIEEINGSEIVYSRPEFTPVANSTMHYNGKTEVIIKE